MVGYNRTQAEGTPPKSMVQAAPEERPVGNGEVAGSNPALAIKVWTGKDEEKSRTSQFGLMDAEKSGPTKPGATPGPCCPRRRRFHPAFAPDLVLGPCVGTSFYLEPPAAFRPRPRP